MLVLNRSVDQGIEIDLQPTTRGTTPAEQLFADGPVSIVVLAVGDHSCRIGINAPAGFRVLRAELRRQER